MKRLAGFFFGLLLVLMGCTTAGERARMRAGLDSINIRNHNDQPFTAQDVEPYVRFFDDHGTPNDQLLAHYLLGRAYYEAGEAPMALQCYHEALDCADTTAQDCDYAQLARVYGQMAQIFYDEELYQQQLQYTDFSVKYSWQANDTLAALMSYEQKYLAYQRLGLIDSAVFVIEDVASKYEQYGYCQYSAIALGAIVRTLVDKGDYPKAKAYMDKYESNSGLFDAKGNIAPRREIYYKAKGLYYLYNNVLDSAEYYFRKELRDGKDFNNQNAGAKGLADLYQKLHCPDSVAKYFQYAYAMSDSLYAHKTTQTVERIQAMYDYTRHQIIAIQEKENAANEKAKRQFSIAMLLLVVAVASYIIYKMYAEKKRKQAQYIRNLEELEQTQTEVLQLRAHAEEYEELIAKKEELLEEQNAKLQEQRKKSLQDHAASDKHIKTSDIYQVLQKKQFGQKLTIQELRDCRKLVLEALPEFNNLLLSKQYKISVRDFDVCMLFRLGFKSKEISNMLDITQGRVSQICTKVLKEIFGEDTGGASELIAMLHKLY